MDIQEATFSASLVLQRHNMGRVSFLEQRRQSLCPRCDVHGKATSVVVGRGVKTVHYVCLGCSHQWLYAQSIPHDQMAFPRFLTHE
jgi:hypothetical protein